MKRRVRAYLGIALALLLALTGQSMAVARGTTGPAGQMVLCTGTGPVSILVDENGQPTGPPHYCPDCVLSLLNAGDLPAAATGVVPVAAATRVWPQRSVHGAAARISRASARAPPVPV